MPSIFEGLQRLLTGKPVFTNEDTAPKDNGIQQAPGVPNQQPAPVAPSHTGPKVIPQVMIEEQECHEHGGNIECRANIKNHSQMQIELDKIRILNTTRELDSFLRPGEEREYLLYSGPRPQNTYNNKAELQYKDPTGDYFASTHYLEFEKLSDNTYTIRRIKFQGPVRDV